MTSESVQPEDTSTNAGATARASLWPISWIARRRPHLADLRQPRSAARLIAATALAVLVVAFVVDAVVFVIAYRGATADVHALRALAEQDRAQLSEADLSHARERLIDLDNDLGRLRLATGIPLADRLVPHLPWVGPRFQAGRQLLAYGHLLADAGASGAVVGEDVLRAFDATGASAPSAPADPTWLDVLAGNLDQINQVAGQVERAKAIRATLNEQYLPESVRRDLTIVDRWLGKVDVDQLVQNDLPSLISALGEDGPQRYMVLFQNPAELRPSGGFPGTGALVTVDRGQLRDYRFFDIHTLTDDYIKQRPSKLPQPYPIKHYFPQDGFLLHDATWWPGFPRSGKQFMEMYAVTDWPAINGVIAMEPTVVSDLLRISGPVRVTVDGEQRLVNADNVYQEIERPRRLRKEGIISGPEDDLHKEVLSLIGQKIIDRLKSANREQMIKAGQAMIAAADRRDVQAYSPDSHIEAMLDRQHWSGRIDPDPAVPTLAITYANLVTTKASPWMHPATTVTFGPKTGGRQQVTLQLDLAHTGSSDADPFYEGYQRWWIQLHLPAESEVVSRSAPSMPDPDAPNGGSYFVELYPGQRHQLTVVFTMPVTDQLLVRRQPGVTPVELTIGQQGCRVSPAAPLTKDVTIDVTRVCH